MREQWHLDKKVPLAIIVAIVVQTLTFVAVGASWQANVENRLGALEKQSDERKGQGDRLIVVEEQLRYIKESLSRIETKLEVPNGGR